MKKFRFILVLAMAVVISGGVVSTSSVVNAATDVDFGSRTVTAGCARRWFPKGQRRVDVYPLLLQLLLVY